MHVLKEVVVILYGGKFRFFFLSFEAVSRGFFSCCGCVSVRTHILHVCEQQDDQIKEVLHTSTCFLSCKLNFVTPL